MVDEALLHEMGHAMGLGHPPTVAWWRRSSSLAEAQRPARLVTVLPTELHGPSAGVHRLQC